jgi:hypothetical protein
MKKMHIKNNQLILLILAFAIFTACQVEDTTPELQEEEEVSITTNDLVTSVAGNPIDGLSLGTVSASASDESTLSFSIDAQP